MLKQLFGKVLIQHLNVIHVDGKMFCTTLECAILAFVRACVPSN